MKKQISVFIMVLSAITFCVSCNKGDEHKPSPVLIEGLTLENFPVMDGSTSSDPLVRTIACELLGYEYKWEQPKGMVTWELATYLPETFAKRKLLCSQTHGAFMNLIQQGELSGFNGPDTLSFITSLKLSATEFSII